MAFQNVAVNILMFFFGALGYWGYLHVYESHDVTQTNHHALYRRSLPTDNFQNNVNSNNATAGITTEQVNGNCAPKSDLDFNSNLDIAKAAKEPSAQSSSGGSSEEDSSAKFKSAILSQISPENIENSLLFLATMPHLAGTKEGTQQAIWMQKKFQEFGFDEIIIKTYNVLVSYPMGPGNITMFNKDGSQGEEITVTEEKLDAFEKATKTQIGPPYLAYSGSGEVEGELVYANFGTEADFRALVKLGIDVKDTILLIRYGTVSRNKKIKYASEMGAKGIILFSDPETCSPTGIFYPTSWYLPPTGVQRGTLLPKRGDALSRGYPAIHGMYRRPIEDVSYLPKVPVQPLGFGHAEKLLKTLDGQAAPADSWNGLLNVTYNVTSQDKRKVKLHVNVSLETRDIKNVVGVIKGEIEPDRLVIIGNHRDAWAYGAADPSSGTAVLVEVARVIGLLKKKGWKPRRTILFCSWDGEEFGLLGSTEWVEEHASILSHQAVAYINVDTAVQGNHTIELKSTPELVDTFFDAAKKVKDPDSTDNLYDVWVRKNNEAKMRNKEEPRHRMFREGSDYMPFYNGLGIPSMDFRYTFDTKEQGVFKYPVYHTIHDNFEWLTKFVDPDFRYHTSVAKVLTQMVLSLSDSTLLPFNFIRYSSNLYRRVRLLDQVARKQGLTDICDYSMLKKIVVKLKTAAKDFHKYIDGIDKSDALAVRRANDKMLLFERTFVTIEDLPGETSTRHVFHTAGVAKAMDALIRNRTAVPYIKEFKMKYSILTYHVMMATHALKSPFMSELNKHMDTINKEDPLKKTFIPSGDQFDEKAFSELMKERGNGNLHKKTFINKHHAKNNSHDKKHKRHS